MKASQSRVSEVMDGSFMCTSLQAQKKRPEREIMLLVVATRLAALTVSECLSSFWLSWVSGAGGCSLAAVASRFWGLLPVTRLGLQGFVLRSCGARAWC